MKHQNKVTNIVIMSAQIIASFVGVGIIAAWAVFLIHQDNKKAKEAQNEASK